MGCLGPHANGMAARPRGRQEHLMLEAASLKLLNIGTNGSFPAFQVG